MRYGIALALICLPLAGQAPLACSAQLVPLKPLSLASCPLAAPSCVTSADGLTGRWVWGCPLNGAAPQSIPIQPWNQPKVDSTSPLDVIRQAEELRKLRLQNQALQNSLNAPRATTPLPASSSDAGQQMSQMQTNGLLNGRFWRAVPSDGHSLFLLGILQVDGAFHPEQTKLVFPVGITTGDFAKSIDEFYSDPQNLPIPIADAMLALSAEAAGAKQSELEPFLSSLRDQQPSPVAPQAAPAPSSRHVDERDGNNWLVMKDFEKSMAVWNTIKPNGRVETETLKALDRFYADPANLKIPIPDAITKVQATVK